MSISLLLDIKKFTYFEIDLLFVPLDFLMLFYKFGDFCIFELPNLESIVEQKDKSSSILLDLNLTLEILIIWS